MHYHLFLPLPPWCFTLSKYLWCPSSLPIAQPVATVNPYLHLCQNPSSSLTYSLNLFSIVRSYFSFTVCCMFSNYFFFDWCIL